MRLALTLLAVVAATPAAAKWDYCHDAPGMGQAYPELPPRSFGFEMAVLPATFKRLCGMDAADEAAHLRRIIADFLQCGPDSDLIQRIEDVLNAQPASLLLSYFDMPQAPSIPQWQAVCDAARMASTRNLAFGDAWYFDSSDPDQDRAAMIALTQALTDFSEVLQ